MTIATTTINQTHEHDNNNKNNNKQTSIQTSKLASKQASKQPTNQPAQQTNKQTSKQTNKQNKQTNPQTTTTTELERCLGDPALVAIEVPLLAREVLVRYWWVRGLESTAVYQCAEKHITVGLWDELVGSRAWTPSEPAGSPRRSPHGSPRALRGVSADSG